jgi:hypothetical protein
MNRFRRGNVTASKLSPSEVHRMRELYNSGVTQGALSREFKVSVGQVGRIVRGEVWQEYGVPESSSEVEHREVKALEVPPTEIAESERKLLELLNSPSDLLEERCAHGIRRGQFCMDCARERGALERLEVEVEKLTPEVEKRVANDLEEFLK